MGIRDGWRALWGQTPYEEKASRTAPIAVQFTAGQPRATPRDYAHLVDEGYRRNVIAYRCVSLITENAAKVPWRLYREDSRGEKLDIGAHPLLDLLARPNPLQGGASFFQAAYAYWLLAGNCYIEAVGPKNAPPRELFTLRPDRMKVLPGETGIPKAYRYTVGGKHIDFDVDPITGTGECLHVKSFNPLDDWYGLSPIEAAAYSIDQHNEAGQWNTALLQKGARPSGALVYAPKDAKQDDVLSDKQRESLKSEIEGVYGGGENAGRPLLLEGGLDWKEMGLSPKDMDWLKGKDVSAREVALAFNVPSQLVGVAGSQTFANYEQATLSLYTDAVLPLIDMFMDELNYWLVPRFGEGLKLGYDEDEIEALEPRRRMRWEKIEQASTLTINEKREAMGYGKIEGGDVVMVSAASLPLGTQLGGDDEPPVDGITPDEARSRFKVAYGD